MSRFVIKKKMEYVIYEGVVISEMSKSSRLEIVFFCKQKTAYELLRSLVGSEIVYKRQSSS